ncbi:hypothetical protein [Commensalibacter oyaizuii]|uniref:Uncharacterized protein n=1 Tax=Commensalibacter oyaizuii TaxID=3043873 RepID=A0ABT6Q3I3_9PROT|nr:hypothetical protein [Commensalibacter sp. TBRC 16381]MDI2091678.1 hypothetical protein [Commensalibacter sp. TBRC 16381]
MVNVKAKKRTHKTELANSKILKSKTGKSKIKQLAIDIDDGNEEDFSAENAIDILHNTLDIKALHYGSEEDEEGKDMADEFQPVDRLIGNESYRKSETQYEQPVTEEENDEEQDCVVIGCRMPNGVVIHAGHSTTLLRGINDMPGKGSFRDYGGIGFTKVTKTLWSNFVKTHKNWPPLQNGSVFISKNKEFWWEGL